MFDFTKLDRPVEVVSHYNLYKWNRHYFKLQSNFFVDEFKLLREKQIEDFVYLNSFDRVHVIQDTDIFRAGFSAQQVSAPQLADLVIVTDQKFSRYPCPEIINQIENLLEYCPNLYLCLNRHYLNIDNSYHDSSLDDNWQRAITQWLKRNLSNCIVVDMSFDWDDRGDYLSWSVPDRHYYIQRL
jgi:hypothetical protein